MIMKIIMKQTFLCLALLCLAAVNGYAAADVSIAENEKSPKILIAYFSMSGNTRLIAKDIQNLVGGDLFEIKPVRKYGPDFDTNVEQAREELKNNARPALQQKVPNMEDYDVIFVGFPNWVGTMPMPVFTFLEEHDFNGKIIVPFCTHGTSGISNTISDLEKLGLNAEIREYIDFFRNDVKDAEEPLRKWLRELGYLK